MLAIIDRYILKLFAFYFFAGLLVFSTIFLAVDAMGAVARFPDASAGTLFSYYTYMLPEVIYQMVPVACLLATIFTISTLNKTNELIALFSCGMSLWRVSLPILSLAGFFSVSGFLIGDQLLPTFTQQKNYIYYVELKKTPALYSTVKTNKIWYRSKNTIFNLKTLSEKSQMAQGLTLYYFNEAWQLLQMVTAKSVEFKGSTWDLNSGSVTVFADESSFPYTSDFEKKTIVMGEEASDLEMKADTSSVLSVKELKRFIDRNKEAGLDTIKYEVDYHAKFSFAFTGIVMSLLGISYSLSRSRSGSTMLDVGVCLLLIFIYWVFYSSTLALGGHGALTPWLAAWLPNIVALAFATWRFRTRRL